MEKVVIRVFVVLGCLPLGYSYPSGAPDNVCADMFPGHQEDSQTSWAPYKIIVSQDSYLPGSNVTVFVQSSDGMGYKGFFLQARKASCRSSDFEMPMGTFFLVEAGVKMISCRGGYKNNAVTHNSGDRKQSKNIVWMNQDGGDVYFQATFVQDYKTFWTGVKSNILKDVMITRRSNQTHPDCPSRTKVHMYPMVSMSPPSFSTFRIMVIISMICFFQLL